MAYTKFPPALYKDRRNFIWFEEDKWEVITAGLDCTFSPYAVDTEAFTGQYYHHASGDIGLQFVAFTYISAGTTETIELTGDIVGALEQLTFAAAGTFTPAGQSSLDCTFETLGFQGQTGLHMGLTMQPWDYSSYYFVEVRHMDSIVFKPFDAFMTGTNQHNQMTVDFERFDAEMYCGSGLYLVAEDFSMEGIAIVGFSGSIDVTLRRFSFFGAAGIPAYINVEFEEFSFAGMAYTEYLAMMDLVMRRFDFVMTGDTPILATLDGRFRPFVVTLTAGAVQGHVASLDITFRPFTYFSSGIKGIAATLALQLEQIRIEMNSVVDGPNGIDVVFKPPEMYMAFDEEDCDLAETLTY